MILKNTVIKYSSDVQQKSVSVLYQTKAKANS